ncbi:MAG TPA: inositol monophosphatase family protein [Burkholderiales bacterium]|jgi:myo-inositol-1(or 4)-monophosphatase|nr:inositol monophosphatase family protein [Burkholderiales bacterium]
MNERELDAREAALAAVAREAGELAKQLFSNPPEVKLKGKQDFITAADGEVERLIIERLKSRFPRDAFLGEEGGASGHVTGTGEAVWVIDPIDGTANFAHRIPHFCVSIAFVSAGELLLGAIAAPMYGELYRARLGRGAFLNELAMRVSDITDLRQAIIELGWSARRPVRAYTGLVERVLDAGAIFMRAGSGALGLAYVAAGRTHGYCELHINSWDTLAGLLLVHEAGGWANDYLSGEALLRGNAVLACAPGLREALVAATGVGQATEKLERRIS